MKQRAIAKVGERQCHSTHFIAQLEATLRALANVQGISYR